MNNDQSRWTVRIQGKPPISSNYVRDYVDNVFAHICADIEGMLAKPVAHESRVNGLLQLIGKKTDIRATIEEQRSQLAYMLKHMDKVKGIMTKALERAFFGESVTDKDISLKAASYLAQGANLWSVNLIAAETSVMSALKDKPEWMQQTCMEIFNQRLKAPLYRRALIEFQAKGSVGDSKIEQDARAEIHRAFEQAKYVNRISSHTEEARQY